MSEPQSEIHVFTSAALNYLPKVRLLFRSLREHHPEWKLHLALADELPPDLRLEHEPLDSIVSIAELGIPDWKGWSFCHQLVELATAIKPFMLARLLKQEGCSRVLYLDPDIVVFSPLDDIIAALAESSIVLTPHQAEPETELAEVILGLEEADAGRLLLDGTDLGRSNVKQRLRAGIGFVPEDRSTDGVVASFTIAENLVLDLYDTPPFARGISMDPGEIQANAEHRTQEFDVRYTSVQDPISTLSGGNQQKVVVAREMSRPLRVLVASQPTRGVDVGSIEFIHEQIVTERDNGTPVLLVSTELDEVMALADRIAVMYRGAVVGIVPGDTDRDVLGLMMAGIPYEEARAQSAEHRTTLAAADEEATT